MNAVTPALTTDIAVVWLLFFNFIALIAMGLDKRRARKHRRRIRERTLFLLAAFGGSLGAFIGMWLFHHKTRHWYFVVGMPLIMALQIAAIWAIWHYIL